MIADFQERRQRDRRAHSRGGRRVTDRAAHAHSQLSCPSCKAEEMANEVSEADGGWWFVCDTCDHLWNERERRRQRPEASTLTDVQRSAF
jgi:uncharacterized Zn ribbon protein